MREKEGGKERKMRTLGGNGQRHVRYTRFTITRRGRLFRRLYESFFCQSVRSLSAAFADEPAGPYVRLLWLLTRDLRATSPLARLTPRVKRPVYHAHKHAAANVRIHNGRKCATSLWRRPYGCAKPRGGQVVNGNWGS